MPRIMIRCPETGTPVATGMSAPDQASFDRDLILEHTLRQCPACDKDHVWDKESAFLGQS